MDADLADIVFRSMMEEYARRFPESADTPVCLIDALYPLDT
jgi:hypothetical protein